MRKSLLFTGQFRVKTFGRKPFRLYNDRFYLETDFFWLGFEKHDWELTTRKVWIQLCQDAEVIFDIGANTGVYALLAKTHNSTAQVHAFEPQPNIYEVLLKNCSLNRFEVICKMVALSDKEGKQAFYNYGSDTFKQLNTTAGSLNKNWKPEDQYSIEVDVTRLDSYINNNEITKIDLLKIDVETLEFEVLSGYGKYLLQHRAIIILEVQNTQIGTNIESLFADHNFAYFNIGEQQGLIPVKKLGAFKGSNKNYVICPKEKLTLLNSMLEMSHTGKDHG